MKFKILLILVICNFSLLFAQGSGNPGSVSGKVIDNTSKQPLPYVNISIFENDKIITGGITQENGSFNIKNLAL
jgi:hypothetical protein